MFADVILPLNLPQVLTYGVPHEMQEFLRPGMRVEVELGRNKQYSGIIGRLHNEKPELYMVKPIRGIIDEEPVVTEKQLQFWRWIGQYYMAAPGEVMQAADDIPPAKIRLLKPPCPVSTGWAYQAWDPRAPARGTRQFHGRIELANDLEGPVFNKFLLLPVIKAWLLEQDEVAAAVMSGSGSTMLAVLRGDAGALAQRANARFGANLWTRETALCC